MHRKLTINARKHVTLVGTLGLAYIAAELCVWLGTPIPWMLGPLLAIALATFTSVPTFSSPSLRNTGQWIMGTSLGLYFTPAVGHQLVDIWWAVLLYVAWSLILGVTIAYVLTRFHQKRMPNITPEVLRATSYFASAIGGASEMTLLAQASGARTDLVATAQSVRMLLVVIVVPFAMLWAGSYWNLHSLSMRPITLREVQYPGLLWLGLTTCSGGWVLNRLRTTNPWFLGPLFVAIGLTLTEVTLSAVPQVLSNAAQLVIGVSLGVRFVRKFMLAAPTWLASVVLSTLCAIALSAGFGYLLSYLTGLHPASAILGTAPGGVTEMSITAKVLQLGVPVVTALQASRLVVLLVIAKPFHRFIERKRKAASP